MDTEDFTLMETADDLVSAILDQHERELFDDELVDALAELLELRRARDTRRLRQVLPP